jgi:hypothetical protein
MHHPIHTEKKPLVYTIIADLLLPVFLKDFGKSLGIVLSQGQHT